MDRDDESAALAAVGRLLQMFVYAPIGAGVKLLDDAPGAVARARQELSNARFIGRMVVSQGEARLREHLADDPVDTSPDESTSSGTATDGIQNGGVDEDGADDAEKPTDATEAGADESSSDVEQLAVPDYDHLPAIDIVDQLESLSGDELDRIEAYERANRRRRTVLGKIDQLRSAT